MFTKIKIPNLKLVRVLVFALIIITGGLLYTQAASAMSLSISPDSNLFTISKTNVSINKDGVYTTVFLVGCLPQSGDKFDMNTGRPCTYDSNTTVIYGCAPRSGDKFDMNTGVPCVYDDKAVYMIACVPGSNDTYNIYTGTPCTKKTFYTETNKELKNENKVLSSESINDKLSMNISSSTISTEQDGNPAEATSEIDQKLSGREILKNGVAASVAKLGNITKGPMSGWLILLILVVIIGGSYGIYSFNFFKKNNESEIKEEVKEVVAPSAPKESVPTPIQSQPVQTTINTQGTIH
jgi:hypothetical protein